MKQRQQETEEKGLEVVDYFAPGNNESVVRRWELFLVLEYVERKSRHLNRWWRVLWRWVLRKPILVFNFFDLTRLELARRAQERAENPKKQFDRKYPHQDEEGP